MDDSPQNPAQPLGLPQGPHFASSPAFSFTPLRLLLQPSAMVVELQYPDLLLGRHSEADIRLPLPDVSRKHCRFQFINGNWQVVDLQSLNGVFVNDQRIDQAVLCQGDRIRIGGFTFLVDIKQATAETTLGNCEALAQVLFKERVKIHAFLPSSRRAS
jgi:pSer/pThr/pTyr-binding forkhead associated (FHA) protein